MLTPPAQEKRRYGSWMLVTKKSKLVDAVKNSRKSRKESNSSTVNHGNQYSVLADVNEHGEPTIARNKAYKGKSKAVPRQTPKDKSYTPTTSVPPTHNSTLPSQAAPPVNSQRTTHNARNRGGRIGAPRGRSRGSGRSNPGSRDNSGSTSTMAGWINQPPPHDVFLFGGTHAPVANAAVICNTSSSPVGLQQTVVYTKKQPKPCKSSVLSHTLHEELDQPAQQNFSGAEKV
nr:LINE-type retrotransposon LIb DNA [Ipomoea batatas]